MRLAGHVARMGRKLHEGSWSVNLEERVSFEEPGIDGRIIRKSDDIIVINSKMSVHYYGTSAAQRSLYFFTAARTCCCSEQKIFTRPDDCAAL
jgi:hypothetical protein